MILPIIKYPSKILRSKTRRVKLPLSAPIRKLIRDMFETVRSADGIGLAAPQVGQGLAIIVINLENMGVPAFALINPEITGSSKKKSDMEEGCLSLPGIYGIVSRPEKIEFAGQDISGKKISASADGLLAKVIQHEIDHINGILIIDKIKKYTQGKELVQE